MSVLFSNIFLRVQDQATGPLRSRVGVGIGLIGWLVLLVIKPISFWEMYFEGALVTWAVVVLAPMAMGLLREYVPAFVPEMWWTGLFVLVAYYRFPMEDAVWWTIPYAIWTFSATVGAVIRMRTFNLFNVAVVAVFVYWFTGVIWLMSFMAGFGPLDFDPTITHLTAAHFHLAGMVLSGVVVLLARNFPSFTHRLLLVGVLAGMPLVAGGIVYTHFGGSTLLEAAAGVYFAIFAIAVVQRHWSLSTRVPLVARLWWAVAGVSLLAGGTLAMLYALRVYFPLEFVTLENMKIFHGSLNAVGFGGGCLMGWRSVVRQG